MGHYDKMKKNKQIKPHTKHSVEYNNNQERIKESHQVTIQSLPFSENKKNKLKTTDLNHLHSLNLRQLR